VDPAAQTEELYMRAAMRKANPAALITLLLIGALALSSNAQAQLSAAPTEISGGAEGAMRLQQLANEGRQITPARVGPSGGAESWHGIDTFSQQPGGPFPTQTIFPGIGFDGYGFDDNISETGFVVIPADPIGAAGMDRVISVVNVGIEARDKTGTLLWRDSLRDFFSAAPGNLGTLTFDPKIVYDEYEDRFLVVALERQAISQGAMSNESRIHVAVSKTGSPASATAADWNFMTINSKINIGGFTWSDYPGFEVDEEAVYITTNQVPFAAGTIGVRLYIINKGVAGGFYSGGAPSFSINDPIPGGFLVITMMPALVHGASGGGPGIGTYLVGYNNLTTGGVGGNEAVQIIRVNNPLGAVSFTGEFVFVGDIEDVGGVFGFPPLPDAPQSGSATLIEVNDSRSLDAVWRNGDIWVTTTINPNSGPDIGETTAHWFQINASAVVNSGSAAGLIVLGDQGDIGGEDIAANTTTSFPSVAVNSSDEAKFGFSASASTIFCGAYVTGRQPADPAGTVQTSQTVRAGTDFYVRTLGTGRNRWGDYSGISFDPSDDSVFWVYNKFADTRGTPTNPPPEDGRWGTAWGPCSFSPLPTETPPPFLSEWGSSGSGQGQFEWAQYCATDDCGNVYVTDGTTNRVQKFDADGNFLLEWGSTGSGQGQFNLATGIAVDFNRNVYVGDFNNARVQKFDEDGNFLLDFGTSGVGDGQFTSVAGLDVDGTPSVFVTDYGGNRVQRFNSNGTFLAKWGSPGAGDGQFQSPIDVDVAQNGDIYVIDEQNNRIQVFNSSMVFTAKWGTPGTGNGQFNFPFGIAIDPFGDVFVTDRNNDRVQKFDASGTFLTTWGTNGSGTGQFQDPRGICVNRSNQIYVVDSGNNRVQKFGIADGPVLPFVTEWGSPGAGPGQLSTPSDADVGASGVVYVIDRGNDRVQKYNAYGGFLGGWGSTGAGAGQFNNPQSLAVGPSESVFVSDFNNDRVQKFDSNGTFLLEWGTTGAGQGQFNEPFGIDVDGSGNVYVTDRLNHRIQKFDNSGNFLLEWGSLGSGDGQFSQPIAVCTDASGDVYVTEQGNSRVQVFNSGGNFLLKWGSAGWGPGQFGIPADVEVDASGNVFIVDFGSERVQQFDAAGNYLTQWGCLGSQIIQFRDSRGIAVDASGDVYVVEDTNARIQRFGQGVVAIDDPTAAPGTFALHPVAPNPIRDQATIRFQLPKPSAVSLKMYDLRGRLVREAMNGAQLPAGVHQFSWDGRDGSGVRLAPGMYFITLTTPELSETRKAILLR
jgi:hypothetical protein